MNLLYKLISSAVATYYRVVFFASVTGLENVPKEGGFLLCANHKSNNDPPFIAAFLPRQIRFLAKKELFENPFFGWFIGKLGAIPLNRGSADTAAIKTSMSIMRDGFGLLVFPQGGRRNMLKLEDIHSGGPAMAQRVGVPILPVGICGDYKPFRKNKLNIGKIITVEELNNALEKAEGDKNAAFSGLIYERLEALLND